MNVLLSVCNINVVSNVLSSKRYVFVLKVYEKCQWFLKNASTSASLIVSDDLRGKLWATHFSFDCPVSRARCAEQSCIWKHGPWNTSIAMFEECFEIHN